MHKYKTMTFFWIACCFWMSKLGRLQLKEYSNVISFITTNLSQHDNFRWSFHFCLTSPWKHLIRSLAILGSVIIGILIISNYTIQHQASQVRCWSSVSGFGGYEGMNGEKPIPAQSFQGWMAVTVGSVHIWGFHIFTPGWSCISLVRKGEQVGSSLNFQLLIKQQVLAMAKRTFA